MAFTVNDLHDMIEIMENNPAWKAELRRVLLGDDFLEIPVLVRQLVDANRKYDERFGRVESNIDKLQQDVGVLKQDVSVLKQDMSYLKGSDLERRIRERPHIYLGRFVRRAQSVSDSALLAMLDSSVAAGNITSGQAEDVERLDALITGKLPDGSAGYLAIEIATTADRTDSERAIRRAQKVQAATGVRTLPIVCGRRISTAMRAELEAAGGGWVEMEPGTPDVA